VSVRTKLRPLVLLWDNFGPLHQDRVRAAAEAFEVSRRVVGIELCSVSDTYDWEGYDDTGFEKRTIFPGKNLSELGTLKLFFRLFKISWHLGRGDYVLCHWNVPGIFLLALWLRISGSKVFTMGCSKFDDRPRAVLKELLKSVLFLPYNGGLASGTRSIDYFRFMGVPADKIFGEYNTVSTARIRKLSGVHSAPDGIAYVDRAFICVARLIEKKNQSMILEAYSIYKLSTTSMLRKLVLCGSGPDEGRLRALATELGIYDDVIFTGFVQTPEISAILGNGLALLLPSFEEQFGNVVPEAQSVGLPVILSDNAGARDLLVRSGVNGFVIEPDNPKGLAFFMKILAEDELLWKNMCVESSRKSGKGDTIQFVSGIQKLLS
jgi:glycosyltransferase involved in cell wall biosynthesis